MVVYLIAVDIQIYTNLEIHFLTVNFALTERRSEIMWKKNFFREKKDAKRKKKEFVWI